MTQLFPTLREADCQVAPPAAGRVSLVAGGCRVAVSDR
ncbi:MAG: hypothetical protein V7603_6247 [Micromonosporaceae bacterium]